MPAAVGVPRGRVPAPELGGGRADCRSLETTDSDAITFCFCLLLLFFTPKNEIYCRLQESQNTLNSEQIEALKQLENSTNCMSGYCPGRKMR